jgi:serine/threonine protein kinase
MNYNILKELGRGGMATVYLAQDKKFDTEVAIKFLNKEFINNENIRKRFIAEAKNMYKMSHPNIIKVTDLIDEGDTVAFVMEHVDGETLKEYLDRKGKLRDEEIRHIFSQMLDAVGYVHEQGLVHRDIKPSNFMIDKEGVVKLLDFGIAKNTDASSAEYTQTGTGMQMGTPMYMSPEQVKNTKDVSFQSDIYSLGVVLWQMVMGTKPYNGDTLSTFEIQLKIFQEPLPLTNSYLDQAIQKATEKELKKRIRDCRIFMDLIKKINKIVESEKTIINPSTITKIKTKNNKKNNKDREIVEESDNLSEKKFKKLQEELNKISSIFISINISKITEDFHNKCLEKTEWNIKEKYVRITDNYINIKKPLDVISFIICVFLIYLSWCQIPESIEIKYFFILRNSGIWEKIGLTVLSMLVVLPAVLFEEYFVDKKIKKIKDILLNYA